MTNLRTMGLYYHYPIDLSGVMFNYLLRDKFIFFTFMFLSCDRKTDQKTVYFHRSNHSLTQHTFVFTLTYDQMELCYLTFVLAVQYFSGTTCCNVSY
jgi:hypothetical protein